MRTTFSSALLSIVVFGSLGNACSSQDVEQWAKSNLTSLIEVYVHLHKNAELSFQEKETGQYVADKLEAAGCEVTRSVGGHGVVGILANGDGPLVMVRCDLDGLPITEQTGLAFASKKTATEADGSTVGTMHACGHDVHMTSMIGVAQYLASSKASWNGKIMFIGQPAEERGAGARAMLDDKLFERFGKPNYALALHCSSSLASGRVGLIPGFTMANVDSIDVEIVGKGGHGAYPHTTIDPIVIAAKLILDLQTIVSREMKPIEPAVVTVGAIHAGTKHNIIPDRCHLQITVRSYSDSVRKSILDSIRRKADAAAMSAGAEKPEITISEGTPALSNDAELTERIRNVFVDKFGAEKVAKTEPVMGGEDFSQFGRAGVPSLMFELGVVEPRKLEYYNQQQIVPPSLHTATFAPDVERALPVGIIAMSRAVLELLDKPKK